MVGALAAPLLLAMSSPLLVPPPSALAGTLEQLELVVAAQAARDPALHARLARALDAVAGALHVFRGAREVAFSFNGGKDSTVVLHLLRLVLLRRRRDAAAAAAAAEAAAARLAGVASATLAPTSAPVPPLGAAVSAAAAAAALDSAAATATAPLLPPPASTAAAAVPSVAASIPVVDCDIGGGLGGVRLVYFETRDNFPEVLRFMDETAAALGVRLETLRGGFKAGLQRLLDEGARCVLMGTRRADPDGGLLEPFSPTSPGWPPLMRVSPALALSYGDVWALLRGARLPFCALYAEGFSSLGARHDSARNPALALAAAEGALLAAARGRRCSGGGVGDSGVDGAGGGQEDLSADNAELASALTEARARGAAFLPAWLLRDGALERAGRSGGGREAAR